MLKATKFLLQSGFYTSEESTCKVLAFYDFWFKFYDKFCSPYPVVDFTHTVEPLYSGHPL